MNRRRRNPALRLALSAALLPPLLAPTGRAAGQTGPPSFGRIPPIDDTTLAGERVRLPADLRTAGGHPCVLILGFSRQARSPVRDWGRRLAGPASSPDGPQRPGSCFFEDPVLASVPRLLRGFVLRSIAAEVSDRGKHHFLPITANETAWRRLAGYSNPNAAYLLVVDPEGQVRWRSSATLSDAAFAELQRQLAAAAAAA